MISIYSEADDLDMQIFLNLGLLGMVLIIAIVGTDIIKIIIDLGLDLK